MRLAQVGTGSRGTSWGSDIVRNFADNVEMVALCDINPKRVAAAKEMMRAGCPVFVEFDRMIAEAKPDCVLVTTTDSSHYTYIIRAMELGCDVITEKPLCTDEEQCQAILDAERKYGRKLTVAFNARHYPEAKKMKQLLLEKAIGDVISVDYQEYLDVRHGASYFRRWHRLKEYSGTLTVSKSCHHFDQVNWWLDAAPRDVVAWGDLKFYGRNHAFRGTRCRGCPYSSKCEFYYDVKKDSRAMQLFVACEEEDGYFVDGCVWRQDVNVQDTFTVMARYTGGARLTYTANPVPAVRGAGDLHQRHPGAHRFQYVRRAWAVGPPVPAHTHLRKVRGDYDEAGRGRARRRGSGRAQPDLPRYGRAGPAGAESRQRGGGLLQPGGHRGVPQHGAGRCDRADRRPGQDLTRRPAAIIAPRPWPARAAGTRAPGARGRF